MGNAFYLNGKVVPHPFDLVIELHRSISVCVGSEFISSEAAQILRDLNNDRRQILLKEVELCQGHENPISYCLLADAYYYLGAQYRNLAILNFEKYLKKPTWIPRRESERTPYIAMKWLCLGDCYEKEHRFQDAILAYDQARILQPERPAAYVKIACAMVKMDKIDLAINLLKKVRETNYYISPRAGTCFNTCIDSNLSQIVQKKNRGYHYKPRSLPQRKEDGEEWPN